MPTNLPITRVCLTLAVSIAAPWCAAQNPTGRTPVPQIPTHPLTAPGTPVQRQDPFRPGFPEPQPGAVQVPEFTQGFPIFPPDFSGWAGRGALPTGFGQPPKFDIELAPPPNLEPYNDWPSWIRTQLTNGGDDLAADRALLVRDADRVWFLDVDEPAFVPLAYYDKVRVLQAGSRVQVRTKGGFQVAFHGGSRLAVFGMTDFAVGSLSEERVGCRFDAITRVWVYGRGREIRVVLPDGSAVTLPASSASEGGCDIFLQRDGTRVTLDNHGPAAPVISGPFGSALIPVGHRVTLATEPRVGQVISGSWKIEGGVVLEGGRSEAPAGRTVRGAGEGGHVEWSGVRVRVRNGVRLRVDPLGGDAFPGTNS